MTGTLTVPEKVWERLLRIQTRLARSSDTMSATQLLPHSMVLLLVLGL